MLDYLIGIYHQFTKLIDTLATWVGSFFKAFFSAIGDFFYAIWDFFLSLFSSMVSAIPVPASWSTGNLYDSLPGQTLWFLNQIGFTTFLLIIFGAYGVRFLLNLIPSWATRV